MEIIELPGYTRDEKLAIAREFLVPRQLADHGLPPDRLDIDDAAIMKLIEGYTREAGVRKLEQQVAGLCRAVAVRMAHGEDVRQHATESWVEQVLGPARHSAQELDRDPHPGQSLGLAWTPSGGDLLVVEARRMPGTGQVHLTGKMGDVMKESAYAAFTYVRARSSELGLPDDFMSKLDVHVHLPAGGVHKDGPSAGITILTAIASMLTRLRTRPDVATTGEITLRGNMLRVGGIKEKCIAAHRFGIKRVVIPQRNEPDLEEVPKEVLDDLEVCLVSKVEEVLPLVLETPPAS